jgi:hypothetical protein
MISAGCELVSQRNRFIRASICLPQRTSEFDVILRGIFWAFVFIDSAETSFGLLSLQTSFLSLKGSNHFLLCPDSPHVNMIM